MGAIFKRDLRAYFSSPLGYVFIAMFLVVLNGYYYAVCIYTARDSLTEVFNFIIYMFTFIIPILTMRTLSEDYKQKTDQLLLTAPVKPVGIVLGKFFSALAVFVVAMLFTLLYLIIIAAVGTPNIGTAIGNYIAIFAVATAYIAIGVFISSLTENQLVSCIATVGVFLALYLLDYAFEILNIYWLKAIIYWLSVFRRFNSFYSGVFSVSDFVYYLSVAFVFLFLTVRVLEKKRWS